MKDVFKNMRGAGLGGLLLMAVVFAVSVVLAGGLYFAKISRGIELNELNDEISAHRTIAPVVASLKARRVETEKLLTPATVYDMPKDVRGLLKTLRVVAQDAGLHNTQFERHKKILEEKGEADLRYEIPGLAGYRVNVFQTLAGAAAAFREIPNTIPTLEELGLPNSLTELSMLNSGLVLLVGPTGSGKSTATAALVNYANEHRREHILTIEDPIEFRYESLGCMVSQREVGLHTTSFQSALRVALREDADIVVVGEMRDRETVRLALQAAETGHLVFATLHTRTAAQSVDRIISIFPEAEQAQMRMVLADTLKAVLSVSFMKRCDIKGRVQAMEIMLVNGAIRNLIREGKTPQINSVIQTSRGLGMCTMDDALKDLFDRGIISRETAAHYARDSDFLKDVRRI